MTDHRKTRSSKSRTKAILVISATAIVIVLPVWLLFRPAGYAVSRSNAMLLDATKNPADWVTHGGTYDEQRFSTLDQINTATVGKLALSWSTELDTNRGQESTSLAVDGRIYLTTAWSKVYALDGKTGRRLWEYDPKVAGGKGVDGCCDVVNRGAAYYDGKVYVGTFDGRLVSLDAADGHVIWSVQTTDTAKPYTITGAPRIVKGDVVIGNGGADMGVRGYVTAYDAQTGAQQWRFYTVPRPDGGPDDAVSDDVLKAKANATWSDGTWKVTGGGGTVWDSIVYDREFDQILVGVGNGSPWNHDLRSGGKGDNLFLSSIVALDASTGKYKWHYQETPGESWDFTATQPIMLATLSIAGQPRKVLMQAPKNGFFYVLDRQTGKVISAKNFTKVTWATSIDLATGRPVEVQAARYHDSAFLMYPSAYGAHNWYPMSFSPRTGLVYLPIQEVPFFYQRDGEFRVRAGTFNTGIYSDKNAFPTENGQKAALRAMAKGALIAWDPVAQREVWRVAQPGPANAGTMVTAGDLVFEGNPQGTFQAFDARNGKTLWKFQARTTVAGSPITYSIDGEQYVLVLSGAGGSFAVSSPFFDDKRAKPNGRVLAFKLGGTAALPAYVAPGLQPATAPDDTFSVAQITRGGRVFETTCSWCHGASTEAGGVLPDLRRSPVLADKETWQRVVIDGLLVDQGMASFARSVSPADAEAVRAYVANRSKLLAAQEKAK